MNRLQSILAEPLVNAVGWALVHFIWQGTLVALLLNGVLGLLRQRSANVRYVAGCAAMFLMLMLPVATISMIRHQGQAETGQALLSTQLQSRPVTGAADAAVQIGPSRLAESRPPDTSIELWGITPWLPWMIVAWLAGVAFSSVRLVGGWLYTRRLRSHDIRAIDDHRNPALQRLCRELRLTRPVRLLESALVKVPTVIGWLRPVILLPVSALTGLTASQLEAIVTHELAHIRRYDYLINLFQALIETLLFYHPAVWWVSRRIRIEREYCCDDLAVAVCGDAQLYARALIELEALRAAQSQLALAANGGLLMNRIQRLVGIKTAPGYRLAGPFAGFLVIAALVSAGLGAQFVAPSSTHLDRAAILQQVLNERQAAREADSAPGSSSTRSSQDSALPSYATGRASATLTISPKGDDPVIPRTAGSLLELLAARAYFANSGSSPGPDPDPAKPVPDADRNSNTNPMVQALHSSNPAERAAAACSLGRAGAAEAMPALIGLLGDDTPIDRVDCWTGGDWNPAIGVLKHASPGEQAAIALAAMGQRAVEPLVAVLDNGNPVVRRNAAWAIGEIRGGSGTNRSIAAEPLIIALSDSDSWVRVAAAFSLGEMRPRRAKEALIAALGDASWNVREMAARALGEMKTREGVESLNALLLRDENERVRRKAAWALGEIRDPLALEALTAALEDQDGRVRATAKWAISEIRD
jgi:HEAT repeat protein/beta-lactamase regulating signal transducer with metallopeptidase domain